MVLRELRRYRACGACITACLGLALAGCGTRPSATAQAIAASGHEGTTPFLVDASVSELRVFLHADGPLAKVGHNHVITSRGLRGTVWLDPQPQRSSCELQLPVETLVVDDPQERAAAGGEYAEPLDESARAGTREHMLGDQQLAAAAFPVVTLQCGRLTAGADSMTVDLTIKVRDHLSQLSVPVKWRRSGNTLEADCEITLAQTALGLEPYSLLLGALRVSDQMQVKLRLVARSS